jgi:hypothetical protein
MLSVPSSAGTPVFASYNNAVGGSVQGLEGCMSAITHETHNRQMYGNNGLICYRISQYHI